MKGCEAESCYMYLTINAWDSGDEIVLVGCRIEDPLAEGDRGRVPNIDVLRLEPFLHEWRFNFVTGTVRERPLDDVPILVSLRIGELHARAELAPGVGRRGRAVHVEAEPPQLSLEDRVPHVRPTPRSS